MRLKEKCILITGSSTGIGAAMARRFVEEGAKIMVHGVDPESAKKVAAGLGKGEEGVGWHAADLSLPEATGELIGAAIEHFGKLDALVNNAAYIPRNNLITTDAATFDYTMAVNLRAPLLLTQAAFEHLKKTKGAVLNIGSVNAWCGETNLLAYSISKGGMMTMTRNLADALGPSHVRVNQMNLGWVLSDSEDKLQQAMGKPPGWHLKLPRTLSPSGRLITPEEVAAAAVYWVSDESQLVSGTVMELAQYPVIGRNVAKENVEIKTD